MYLTALLMLTHRSHRYSFPISMLPHGRSLACHASATASFARSVALAHRGTPLADCALTTALISDKIARLFAVRLPASAAPPIQAAPAIPVSAAAKPRAARRRRPISSAPLGLTSKPPILAADAAPAPAAAKPRATNRRRSINSMPLGTRRPIRSTTPSAAAAVAVAAQPATTISSAAPVARQSTCGANPRRRRLHDTHSAILARAATASSHYPPATAIDIAVFNPMLPCRTAAPAAASLPPSPVASAAESAAATPGTATAAAFVAAAAGAQPTAAALPALSAAVATSMQPPSPPRRLLGQLLRLDVPASTFAAVVHLLVLGDCIVPASAFAAGPSPPAPSVVTHPLLALFLIALTLAACCAAAASTRPRPSYRRLAASTNLTETVNCR